MPTQTFSDFVASPDHATAPVPSFASFAGGQTEQPAITARPQLPSESIANPDQAVAGAEQFARTAVQGPTISALPAPSLLDRAKGVVMGDVRTGDTALGRATGRGTETVNSPTYKQPAPLVRFESAVPEKGIARGVAEAATGLADPANLELIAGTAGLGEAAPVLSKLLAAGFSAQMLHGVYQQIPEFRDAVHSGDWAKARQVAARMATGSGLAALGLKHASNDIVAGARARVADKTEAPIANSTGQVPGQSFTDFAKENENAKSSQPESSGSKQTVTVPSAQRGGGTVESPQVATGSSGPQQTPGSQGQPVSRVANGANNGPNLRGGGASPGTGLQTTVPPHVREGNGPGAPVSGLHGARETGSESGDNQPEPAAGGEGENRRRVTGSADIPLNGEGKQQAADLAARVGKADRTFHAPNLRSQETAHTVDAGAKPADWLEPWRLGAHEGKPLDSERDAINDRVVNNPDSQPGVSPHSGEQGESFNEVRRRLISGAQDQAEAMPHGSSVLNVTSGRALQIIDAWAKTGNPADNKVSIPAMTADSEFSKPGQLFRLDPGGLNPVDKIDGPGQYFAQHGATEWNASAKPGGQGDINVPNVARETPASQNVPGETLASGFGALQPLYERAVESLKESASEMRALKAKRDVALEALKAAEFTPEEKQLGKRVREFMTGERDMWGVRVNQAIERLRKIVPDTLDQEALSLMRDFKSRPGELQQFALGTHPDLAKMPPDEYKEAMANLDKIRPVIARALNPTPQMRVADGVLTQIADMSLKEGQKVGFLESSISPEEYVSHLLHPKGEGETPVPFTERGRAMAGKIGRNFSFGKERTIPTLVHAVSYGLKPRTLNAFDAFTIHADKFATARATNKLIGELKNQKVGKWGAKAGEGNIPEGWVEIAPHAHPFQNLRAFTDEQGEAHLARQTLFVPKYIEEALRPITDPDYTSKIPGFTKARMFQGYTKAIELGLSLFHAKAENIMALANMGPTGWAKAQLVDRASPQFLEGERRMVLLGGTSPIEGRVYEAYKSLQPGSIPTWTDIWRKAPAIKQADQLAQGLTDFIFNNQMRRFKVMNFVLQEARWIGRHPNATPEVYTTAMHSITNELNAVYGGLHWENLGVNRQAVNILRAIMLAPDWTFSNIFNVKAMGEGGIRGTEGARMARLFWMRAIVGGLAATQGMSLLMSGKPSKRSTMVYLGTDKEGKEIYQNIFFSGAPGDAVNLVNNVKDYGALLGVARSVAGKEAPIPRTVSQLFMNRNYLGQKIARPDAGTLENTVRGVVAAAKSLAPIPFTVNNLYDMLNPPPGSDAFNAKEMALTLLFGQPPHHNFPQETKAEKLAHDILGTHVPDEERTDEQMKRASLRRQMSASLRAGKGIPADVTTAMSKGELSKNDRVEAVRAARRPPLVNAFMPLSIEDALRVYKIATPEEKAELRPFLLKKRTQAFKTSPPADRARIAAEIRAALQ